MDVDVDIDITVSKIGAPLTAVIGFLKQRFGVDITQV